MPADAGRLSRLLMTADAVGGVWTYALELARALGGRGVEVALAVLGPAPSRAQREEIRRIPTVALFAHPGRLEWMEEPWREVAASSAWLLDLERAVDPDLVHLNGYCHGALPWRAPVLMAGHSCVRSWWRAVHRTDAPGSWDRYSCEVARGLRAAGTVVAPSHAMMRALEEHYGPFTRARVIANGRTAGAPAETKEPFVLTAGRLWDAAKNVEAVCAAAPGLPWPVYLAGPLGERPFDCRNVHTLGPLAPSELGDWMARASIYALPARYEPFGLSILEAAQASCALVLGRIDSLEEVWGDAAIFVDPDDAAELRRALVALIEDDVRRGEMRARATARARGFSAERMAAGYIAEYQATVEAGRQAALP